MWIVLYADRILLIFIEHCDEVMMSMRLENGVLQVLALGTSPHPSSSEPVVADHAHDRHDASHEPAVRSWVNADEVFTLGQHTYFVSLLRLCSMMCLVRWIVLTGCPVLLEGFWTGFQNVRVPPDSTRAFLSKRFGSAHLCAGPQ